MAEFVEVFTALNRMCDERYNSEDGCRKCPVFMQGFECMMPCGPEYASKIEKIVLNWAAEHPRHDSE